MNDNDDYIETLIIRIEERDRLIDAWRIALWTIASGADSATWGRIALEALDKERKP